MLYQLDASVGSQVVAIMVVRPQQKGAAEGEDGSLPIADILVLFFDASVLLFEASVQIFQVTFQSLDLVLRTSQLQLPL